MGQAIRRRFCINADRRAVDKPCNIGHDSCRKISRFRIFGECLLVTRRLGVSGDGRLRNLLIPLLVQSILFSKSSEEEEEDGENLATIFPPCGTSDLSAQVLRGLIKCIQQPTRPSQSQDLCYSLEFSSSVLGPQFRFSTRLMMRKYNSPSLEQRLPYCSSKPTPDPTTGGLSTLMEFTMTQMEMVRGTIALQSRFHF